MNADLSFLIPLALTVLIETSVAVLLGIRKPKQLVLVALANIVTNPLLHLLAGAVYRTFGAQAMRAVIYIVLEPLVILAEGWIYQKRLGISHPYRVSVIMNMVTIAGGVIWTLLSH